MGKTRVIAETGAGQRRRQRDRGGVLRPRLHRLHGLGRHPPPGPQRGPDAPARCQGGAGRLRQRHPQGRDQRGAARLGRQRRPHGVPLRHRSGPHPFPMVRDFTRGIGTRPASSAWTSSAGSPTRSRRAWAAARTRSACSAFLDDEDVEIYGFEAAATGSTGRTPRRSTRGAGRAARLPHLRAPGRGRPDRRVPLDLGRTGLPRRRPQHAHLAATGRATYLPVTDAEAMDALALLSRTKGSSRSSPRTIAGALRVAERLATEKGPDATC